MGGHGQEEEVVVVVVVVGWVGGWWWSSLPRSGTHHLGQELAVGIGFVDGFQVEEKKLLDLMVVAREDVAYYRDEELRSVLPGERQRNDPARVRTGKKDTTLE